MISPTGNCTDNGCQSQWENRGSCVDFSSSVDFEHVGKTFNLSSGSKPGLCGHQGGKKDCCHCLQLINWDGDCVQLSADRLSSFHMDTSTNTREHCIESCQSANFRYACWCLCLWLLSLSLYIFDAIHKLQVCRRAERLKLLVRKRGTFPGRPQARRMQPPMLWKHAPDVWRSPLHERL